MNDKMKQAVSTILEVARLIGSIYAFYEKHEEEIKDIFRPFLMNCIETGNKVIEIKGEIE